jgi:hypothetical protein
LKVRVIRSDRKFNVESWGVALINTGGIESLGPPCGGIMLAQEPPNRLATTTKNNIATGKTCLIEKQT